MKMNEILNEQELSMNPDDIMGQMAASKRDITPADIQQILNNYKNRPPQSMRDLVRQEIDNIDITDIIGIALSIGAPHLSFLQSYLINQGIAYSHQVMQDALAKANIRNNA
tara:strand:- start:78 stop:410 length:333 start_codon:yes stop_codon:yes gene_type:complete